MGDVREIQRRALLEERRAEQARAVPRPAPPSGAASGYPQRMQRLDRSIDVHEMQKGQLYQLDLEEEEQQRNNSRAYTRAPAPPAPAGRRPAHFVANPSAAGAAAVPVVAAPAARPDPPRGVSDLYVLLDSWEKAVGSNLERGELVFDLSFDGATGDQRIGVRDPVDNVIGVEVGEFCIPPLPYDNFDPALLMALNPAFASLTLEANGPLPAGGDSVTNAQSQLPFCGRTTMFVKELGMQAYSGVGGRRHHFEFEAATTAGGSIRLDPLGGGEFIFTDPIRTVNKLSVSFYNPGTALKFPPDCLHDVRTFSNAGGHMVFKYTDPTNLINLAVGDRITIRGFTSTSVVLNTYIARPEGHIVGLGGFLLVPPTSSTSGTQLEFRLNPDYDVAPIFDTDVEIVSSTQVVVCIAKNRMRIPLRFRCSVPRQTNFISPVGL